MNGLIEAGMRVVLAEEGFKGCETGEWSLSYCQDAGVSFKGTPEEPAALLARFLPADLHSDIPGLFDDERHEYPAAIRVKNERYGPGLPHTSVEFEDGTVFDESESDTGHDALARGILMKAVSTFEEEIKKHVRHTTGRMVKVGYQILESCDPFWWAGELEQVDERDTRYAVLRRIEVGEIAVEFRLYPLSDFTCDYEMTEVHDERLKGLMNETLVMGELLCVVGDRDFDETWASPAYVFELDAKNWRNEPHLRQIMRETLSDAVADYRAENPKAN